MNQIVKRFNRLINLCLVSSVVSSSAIFICVIAGDSLTADAIYKIMIPVVFWIGFVFEQIFIWKANSLRKKTEERMKYSGANKKIGLLSLVKTTPGKIADICFIVSLGLYLILCVLELGISTYQFAIIAIIVLSFRFHCIFNGKNYRYKEYLALRRIKHE